MNIYLSPFGNPVNRIMAGLFMLCLLAPAARCKAQQASHPPVFLTKPCEIHLQNATLEEMTRYLRTALHLNILVDGEPLRKQNSVDLQGTTSEALDRIAAAFDYQWKVTRSGVILFTKRFMTLRERPQLIPDELQQMVRDIDQVLNTIPGEPTNNRSYDLAAQFTNLLTPAQTDALNQGRALRSADLTGPQIDGIGLVIEAATFDFTHQRVRELMDWLDALRDTHLHDIQLYAKAYGGTAPGARAQVDVFLSGRGRDGKELFVQLRPYELNNLSKEEKMEKMFEEKLGKLSKEAKQ